MSSIKLHYVLHALKISFLIERNLQYKTRKVKLILRKKCHDLSSFSSLEGSLDLEEIIQNGKYNVLPLNVMAKSGVLLTSAIRVDLKTN